MNRFCDLVKKMPTSPRRFVALCSVYKSQELSEQDLLLPDKSPDELYTDYNRRTHNVTDGAARRAIASELHGEDITDDDFNAIEDEAHRRKSSHFDMGHFHQKLKDKNLWQWSTQEEGDKLWEDQHDEINATMDEVAGRPLTLDEIDSITDKYTQGHLNGDGEYAHTDGVLHDITSLSETRNRLNENESNGNDNSPSMVDVAAENQKRISTGAAGDDDGLHDGVPVGEGWEKVPGGSHNGFRRQKDGNHEYWYPTADHAAGAAVHHSEQSERMRKKLGDAMNSPHSTGDDLSRLLDAHVHHETESRRATHHHKEHSKKDGPHVSSHEKSMYRAPYLSMVVKAKLAILKTPAIVSYDIHDYRTLAMGVYFKAEAYDSTNPHSKLKMKPPGGEAAGWEPMKRTRHSGWKREQPNGQTEYWYPTDYHARSAEVSHREQSMDAANNARSAQELSHQKRHETASQEHAVAADGAKKFHENSARQDPSAQIPNKILQIFSDIVGKPVKAEDLKKMSYSKNLAGKELMSIDLRFGKTAVAITPELIDGYDTDLNSLCEFLEAGGAKTRG